MAKFTISLLIRITSVVLFTKCAIHAMYITMNTFTSQSPIYNSSSIDDAVEQYHPLLALYLAECEQM
jgi:hypothetical protein